MRTVDYSTFLTREAALIGVGASDLQSDERAILNAHFNGAVRTGWERMNWIDLCPFGEARFVGNGLTYPNAFTNSAWTATALTITDDNVANPADGKTTAAKMLETAATSAHGLSQSVTFLPNTQYTFFWYARYLGRQYVKLTATDGTDTWSSFFDILNGLGGTASTGATANILQASNGFFLCSIQFTSSTTAGAGSVTFNCASDASTTNYAGTTTKGVYAWGALLVKNTNTGPQDSLVAWEQEDESPIEAILNAWEQAPTGLLIPRAARYQPFPNGIQFYSSTGTQWYIWAPSLQATVSTPPNPVYLYYRKQCPTFTGEDYSASATYAADAQVYFTDSNSVSNYWKCLAATTAGQSPENTPAKWELLEIPAFLIDYLVYRVFSDWLRVEGQFARAEAMSAEAEKAILDQADRQERQMYYPQFPKVQTHLQSQAR